MTDSTWKAWAREARRRGPRCPDVETLRLWAGRTEAGSASTDPSWRATDAHVHECARCRIEAEELRAFFAPGPGGESERARAETERIRDLLGRALVSGPLPEDAGAARPSGATAPPFPGPPARVPVWEFLRGRPWILAIQMALVVGVGLVLLLPVLREDRAPAVPALDSGQGILRGDLRPRLLAPSGEQSSAPRRFEWEAGGEPPRTWIFRLERVDGSLVWSAETPSPSVELPEGVARSLRPGSRYIWRVQAREQPSSPASASFDIAP